MLLSAPHAQLIPSGCLSHLYRLLELPWRAAGCQRLLLFRGLWGHNWLFLAPDWEPVSNWNQHLSGPAGVEVLDEAAPPDVSV